MSLTVSITATNTSILKHNFCPEVELEGEYEMGLILMETYNTITNVNSKNNNFYYGDEKITIMPGCYEIFDILSYLEKKINPQYDEIDELLAVLEGGGNNQEKSKKIINFKENKNTFKIELFCEYDVHFDKPNNIGSILGFGTKKLEAKKWHISEFHVKVFDIDTLFITSNVTGNAYHNSRLSHAIFQACLDTPPGHRFSIQPQNIIYYPIIVKNLGEIYFKIVDQNENLISFGEESITIAVHIRKRKNYAV